MTVSAGSRLGPYEILSPLGAGGMGDVYRARDERLKRQIAIKVLPASFSADADRLRRFEQEAQAAGSLNHSNILAIWTRDRRHVPALRPEHSSRRARTHQLPISTAEESFIFHSMKPSNWPEGFALPNQRRHWRKQNLWNANGPRKLDTRTAITWSGC
jgi:serine/threonine protein kinase